jgi:hypothetical protein
MFWSPGWVGLQRDEFRETLSCALRENRGGWIIDGRYGDVANILDEEATDIICELAEPCVVLGLRIRGLSNLNCGINGTSR